MARRDEASSAEKLGRHDCQTPVSSGTYNVLEKLRRSLLANSSGLTEAEIAGGFKRAKAGEIALTLQSLQLLGIAVRYRSKDGVRWKLAG